VVRGHVYLFDVFGPKVLAGVALALDRGTMSRCIDIKMLPKLPDEKVEDFKYVDMTPSLRCGVSGHASPPIML
jgi:hypothetical protein